MGARGYFWTIIFLLTFLHTFLVSSHPQAGEEEEGESDADLINEFIKAGPPSEGGASAEDIVVPQEKTKNSGIQASQEEGPPPSPGPPAPPVPPLLPLSKQDPTSSGEASIEDTFDEPNKNCQCVKYYLCNIDNGTVVDNGDVLGLIDIRLGASKPSACPHYFDICCPTSKQTSPQDVGGVHGQVIPPEKQFEHSTCGKRNTAGVGFRITGADNQEAQFGEFPWMVAIVRQERQGEKSPLNIYLCGGSLIHPQVILTAAHCVYGKQKEELKVRLGEWDTQTPHEIYPHQDRYVSRIVIHEAYYSGALFNDIALLYLTEPATLAPNIDTVCLPPPNLNFDGQTCYASGWGKNTFGQDGKYQVILKKVELPVVPVDQCQRALRRTRLGPHFKLHNSFVCAGGEAGRDTCRGDGGSPLVCQLPDSPYYTQVGIVSWGIGCGERGTPGVYVNIPLFVPWITEQLRKSKMDSSYYKLV